MKIRNLIILLFTIISVNTVAQTNDLRVNIGVPLGVYGKFDHNFTGSDVTNYPSLLMQLEKTFRENFSIGAYVGYTGQHHEYNFGHNKIKFNYYRAGTSLTYELNEWLSSMNLSLGYGIDMYTSIKAGISLENKKTESTSLNSSSNPIFVKNSSNEFLLDLGILLGSRYYFSDRFGIFSELGWGNAGFFTIGTTLAL